MRKIVAFADEFGNNSFDFKSQSTHFIIASVIINADELDVVNQQLEVVRKKFFQKGEIKSKGVSKDFKRRKLILNSFEEINFSIYAVVVDKEKLFGEGFKYKQSFYKFLNGILYKELYRTFPQLELIVDEHGGNDFMLSFKKYVENNHIRSLFSGSEFIIQKSHNELGVQLADFIAGTLGYIFDKHKKSEHSDDFFRLLSDKLISINHFPKQYEINQFQELNINSEYDETIATLSLNRIFDKIERIKGDSEEKIDKLNFLKLLILFHQSKHYKKYTTSEEFIKHINVSRTNNLSKESFTSLVGSLRDEGILIASSRDGYKIPTSKYELKKFIQHGKNIIFPVMRRIEECRNAILLATNNSCDILDDDEFKKLREIVEFLK
jgi:biotin operon repressor